MEEYFRVSFDFKKGTPIKDIIKLMEDQGGEFITAATSMVLLNDAKEIKAICDDWDDSKLTSKISFYLPEMEQVK